MLKAYQISKAIIVFAVLTVAAILLSLDSGALGADGKTRVKNFEIARDFLFYDPYNSKILTKVEKYKKDVQDIFSQQYEAATNLMSDKIFVEEVFAYLVSQKIMGMDALIKKYFMQNANFRDLIIIDTNNGVLYKYSGGSVIAEYNRFNGQVRGRVYNDKIGLITRYREDNFDIDLQVVFLYSDEMVTGALRAMEFPAFFSIDGQLYRNSAQLPPPLVRNPAIVSNRARVIEGFKIFESCPVTLQNGIVGGLMLFYPTRSVASIFLSIFKVALLIGLLAGLYLLDRKITRSLGKETPGPGPGRKKKDPSAEAADSRDESRLEWIETYIQGTEEKNERKK